MAVGPQDVVRGTGDRRSGQCGIVVRIRGNLMHLQHVAEAEAFERWRGLPDHEQVEPRVIERLEQILAWSLRLELQTKPRKAIASMWRGLGRCPEFLREGALAVANPNL